ncbi:hypothetical protein QF050_002607 [Arthrobacter sp. SLBN-112]|nr:hypothetical protein [Arthrobacter sp. SLBN-112]
MGSEAVVEAFEAIDAAIALLRTEIVQPGCANLSVDPQAAVADECLDVLAGVARTEARVAALKSAAVAAYAESARSAAPADRPVQAQEMAIAAEVGCVLAIGDRAAGALLAQSCALATSLPLTLSALQAGTVSWQHARVMVDETAALDRDAAGALEAHFLDADAANPARGCLARCPPSGSGGRPGPGANGTTRTASKNGTPKACRTDAWNMSPSRTGWPGCPPACQRTKRLRSGTASPPSPGACRVQTRTERSPSYGRTYSQRQPCDATPAAPAAATAPAPAQGPVQPMSPRRGPRSWSPYLLTKAMRNWLRMRDGKCPFPGCNNHSLDNEADHLLAWHHGRTTGISNLGQPCPRHHRLKHLVGWKPTPATKNEPPGWVSPSGRHYKSEHQDWEPAQWPPLLQPRAGQQQPTYPPTPTTMGGTADYLQIPPSAGEECLRAFLGGK